MLDMGFVHESGGYCGSLPTKRQTLFFSATMPSAIAKLTPRCCTTPSR